jgi:patatin-related protein
VADSSNGSPRVAPPPFEKLREIRLAVVMYGGVSLAIYMHGVTQELLRLVRATAPRGTNGENRSFGIPHDELRGSELVYRKLAQLGEEEIASLNEIKPGQAILTQFVIDILSGTSAGGINAVYLAKALANAQSMQELTNLWVEEGDVAKLLNDGRSGKDIGLRVQGPPKSLLNGQRMYFRLLQALDGMDKNDPRGPSDENRVSPYADELDLFVTTTDLRGLTLPIPLTNGKSFERRYRNVLHFTYATREASGADEPRNDFHRDNNPFLAFASRCTSAFPFAFEPMTLHDIERVMPLFGYRGSATSARWSRFYRDYIMPPAEEDDGPDGERVRAHDAEQRTTFAGRAFGDGGALDNKPFSYATERLLRRRADLPVDRKLLFIEPEPGHPEAVVSSTPPPDVVQNALLQGALLPREETVRDDIQRIMDRNETIRRADSMLQALERDIRQLRRTGTGTGAEVFDEEFLQQDLTRAVVERGVAEGAYRRLRVEVTLDDLAATIGRTAQLPSDSMYIVAIRYLFDEWRSATFQEYLDLPSEFVERSEAVSTLNWFLFAFDIGYRFRRLNLLGRKIDDLYRLGPTADGILEDAGVAYRPDDDEARADFRAELLKQKHVVNDVYVLMRVGMADLRDPRRSPLVGKVAGAGISLATLRTILDGSTDEERRRRAHEVYSANPARFSELGEALAGSLIELTRTAKERWVSNFAVADGSGDVAADAARTAVRYLHDNFEDYDAVSFPLGYGTSSVESDIVDVVRVSPEDARSLVDVTVPGNRKLTGGRFGHFGAFLDRSWRENDILWGRLDASEILIETILGHERKHLVPLFRESAQARILEEDVWRGLPTGESPGSDGELVRAFRESYRVPTQLPPREMLQSVSRGSHIMGNVFKDVADQRRVMGLAAPFVWIARAGQASFGLVEASIPGTWHHLIGRHWLALILVFEILAFLGGLVFGVPAVQQFGVLALLVTGLVVGTTWLLGNAIRGGQQWRKAVAVLVILLIVSLIILSALKLVDLGREYPWIPVFGSD